MSLHQVLLKWRNNNESGVLACSALKKKYRILLNTGRDYQNSDETKTNNQIVDLNVIFVLIDCQKSILIERLRARVEHEIVKDVTFLDTQFAALELPKKITSVWSDEESYLCKEEEEKEELELKSDKKNEQLEKFMHRIFVLNCNSSAMSVNDCVEKIKSLITIANINNY
jgi:gluconate kinase